MTPALAEEELEAAAAVKSVAPKQRSAALRPESLESEVIILGCCALITGSFWPIATGAADTEEAIPAKSNKAGPEMA